MPRDCTAYPVFRSSSMYSPLCSTVDPIQTNNNLSLFSSMSTNKNKVQNPKARRPKRQSQKAQMPKVNAPLASTQLSRNQRPNISYSNPGGDARIRVRHREFITDIAGSAAFANTAYEINVGLARTFPWLTSIANSYESYQFHSLCFEFETSKSASTNGSIMLSVDFDASDPAPLTKQQLMSYNGAVRSAVWAECEYISALADLRKFGTQRFVRHGPVTGDIKTYDVGNLFVATSGCADTSIIGELYVCYDVELMTPQTSQGGGSIFSARIVGNTNIAPDRPFGDSPQINGGGFFTISGQELHFTTTGQFLVSIITQQSGGDMPYGAQILDYDGGVSQTNIINASWLSAAGTTTTGTYLVNVTSIPASIYPDTEARNTLTGMSMRISEYAYLNA